MDLVDDLELDRIADARLTDGQEPVRVSLEPFELAFHPEALREWRKLTPRIREQFRNKLAERLTEPRIPASKLHGSCNRCKIKLRTAGYRLFNEVRDHELLVLLVAVGKR